MAAQKPTERLYYIENLRIFLSALVVVVHVACTYGGPGGWGYIERGADIYTVFPLTVLNATSQSFFMGMFFLIGAYFTHLSYQRKGGFRFIKDRIIRLGIPLALTYFLISPVSKYIIWPIRFERFADATFLDIWKSGHAFSHGVMWFVEALLIFTALYILSRIFFPSLRKKEKRKLPQITAQMILISSVVLGIVTFLVRIRFSLFKNHLGLGFDIGHFPQYIFLFIVGIIAARYDSIDFVSFEKAKKWGWFILVMIIVVFPLLFIVGEAWNGLKPFIGGATWQSLAYSVWEQVTGISIMVMLLGVTRIKWNWQSAFAKKLSASAYAVYVIHPPVLYLISVLFMNWKVMLLVKFLAIFPLALLASFGIALIIKQIPILKRIF